MNLERIEKAIEDAFYVATTQNINTDAGKRHFKFMLRQIAVNAIDTVRNENNSVLYEIQNKLK